MFAHYIFNPEDLMPLISNSQVESISISIQKAELLLGFCIIN
ncbi:hypothetical protein HMPREF9373_1100 [Psychrobacter sp. 1501(2011)]|nr:hypothetical protein HMPREF9373_1100 [Psychrobacter sp. 1501(2011)]